jgi:hypothetical protein
MNITQLNNNTILVKPEFHIISGRKKLRVEDLKLPAGVVLPPEQVASLGSKKFIDPDEIAKFNRRRDQAHKACEKIGVKFLGGYAIPKDKIDELVVELDEKVGEFNAIRDDFLRNYEVIIDSWCSSNAEWESILRRAVPPVSSVAASLSATYFMFQAGVPEGISSERLDEQASGLSGQMYLEIAKEAERFINESLSVKGDSGPTRYRDDQEGVTQKALRPIRRMRDKMEGLSFLDSGIQPVIKHIDQVLAQMPDQGRIDGKHFSDLLTLAIAMSDKTKIKMLGTALSTGVEDTDFGFDQTIDPVLSFDEGIEPITPAQTPDVSPDTGDANQTIPDEFSFGVGHTQVVQTSGELDLSNNDFF